MNIDEVKTVVGRGKQAAEHAKATIAQTGDRIDEARRLVAVTHDSDHEQVKLGRARLKEAATEAKRVFDLLGAGVGAAEKFHRALG